MAYILQHDEFYTLMNTPYALHEGGTILSTRQRTLIIGGSIPVQLTSFGFDQTSKYAAHST